MGIIQDGDGFTLCTQRRGYLPMNIDSAHTTLPEGVRIWHGTIDIQITNVAHSNIRPGLRKDYLKIHA